MLIPQRKSGELIISIFVQESWIQYLLAWINETIQQSEEILMREKSGRAGVVDRTTVVAVIKPLRLSTSQSSLQLNVLQTSIIHLPISHLERASKEQFASHTEQSILLCKKSRSIKMEVPEESYLRLVVSMFGLVAA